VTLDVFDDEGKPVTEQIGELVLLEPFVGMSQSFWQDKERYLETYWSRFPGVWAHGDLARRSRDGHFFLLGRSDDTLKIAGKRVGPAEVEETVLASSYVAEAAAIGLPDSLKGQQLVVFIVPTPEGAKQPSDRLAAFVTQLLEEQMGKPFRPEGVYLVEELPKNRSRKIMRRLIRDVCVGGRLGDVSSLENPTALESIRRSRAHVTITNQEGS
jgi:acetyl-CoA synthetase